MERVRVEDLTELFFANFSIEELLLINEYVNELLQEQEQKDGGNHDG